MITHNLTPDQARRFVRAFDRADKIRRFCYENRNKYLFVRLDHLCDRAWRYAQEQSPVLLFSNGELTAKGKWLYNSCKISLLTDSKL